MGYPFSELKREKDPSCRERNGVSEMAEEIGSRKSCRPVCCPRRQRERERGGFAEKQVEPFS